MTRSDLVAYLYDLIAAGRLSYDEAVSILLEQDAWVHRDRHVM